MTIYVCVCVWQVEDLRKQADKMATKAQKKKKKKKTDTGEEDELQLKLAQLLNAIERLKGLLSLVEISSHNRKMYMNAWTYHYLKQRV